MVIFFCFSRAHLQGDLVLQSHCTEGLKEAKWDVIIATGAAVTGNHFSWMTDWIYSTLPCWWPSFGLWDFSVCQHKDDAVLWALDFILLKGEAPQTLFNTTDKYILIETKWENFTWCFFIIFFYICPLERAGVSLLPSH